MDNSTRKEHTKQKLDKILGDFEYLKSEARNTQSDRKAEIEENIKHLEEREAQLRKKYEELESFGETAIEEIMNSIFSSAEAFSDDVKNVKKKL
jgi:predicted nuclease with TOPRIM domain